MRVTSVMESVRMAFCCGSWKPSHEQWVLAGQCVQQEEKDRIDRFVFKKDCKSAMAGRLLIRKVIHDNLEIPYDQILLQRTEKGKPFLSNPIPARFANFNFNVSHQGGYAVLAAESLYPVGIDVMEVETPRGQGGVKRFFNTMSRQFTYQEWTIIRHTADEWEQLGRFYRLWCLKEAYVKALGVGIGFELQRLDFHIHTHSLNPGSIATDTQVFVDGQMEPGWRFEETKLDDTHHVAVALHHNENQTSQDVQADPPPFFTFVTFDDLVRKSKPLSAPDEQYWTNFSKKQERPGVLN